MPSSRVRGAGVCSLSRRWKIEPRLAQMVVTLDQRAAAAFATQGLRWPGLWIISGFRPAVLQASLNPLVRRSRHTRCPSMAIDLRVGDFPASTTPVEVWATLGGIWKTLGGRWGGDFRDPDVNHFETLNAEAGPILSSADATLRGGDATIDPGIQFRGTRPVLIAPPKALIPSRVPI